MNKYKVIYYMSVLALIVNAFAMVGTLLGGSILLKVSICFGLIYPSCPFSIG